MFKPAHSAALVAAGLLAACAAGPDYERPRMDMPQEWQNSDQGAKPPAARDTGKPAGAQLPVKKTGDAGEKWWTLYSDPVLNRLEDEAFAHNNSVQVAVASVLLARAQLGYTEGGQYPSVTANARESRTKVSSVGTVPLPAGYKTTQNLSHLSLDASWELDLWGKYRRASEAARASLLSAEAARDAAYLSLSAQVAQQYFALLAFDAQEALLKRAQAGRQEMIALDRKKVEVGVMSEYDLHQAEADEASIRSQLASLSQARDRQEAALAVLLGRPARDIMNGTVERGAPQLASVWVPEGLPSDLLLRRPDVRAAEMNLVSLNAQIGVARAQYFPSLTLTGYLGKESASFSKLFTNPANIFQFAGSISEPIFNAGRTGYLVDSATANRDAALAQYKLAVANAFADLRNALSAQDYSRQIYDAETARSKALSEATRQAEVRYKVGVSSRLEVLDVEKNYLQADLNRIEAERAQRSAVADLFKALGGGWKADAGTQPAAASSVAAASAPKAEQQKK
ncbi:MAG TPA: efflux transporter outer membrane subunit [Gallionellaceae bacterium]